MSKKVSSIFDGVVASAPSQSPNGVSLKVMIPALGDTFTAFIAADAAKGEQDLNLGDPCKVHYRNMYQGKNGMAINVVNIFADTGKKS